VEDSGEKKRLSGDHYKLCFFVQKQSKGKEKKKKEGGAKPKAHPCFGHGSEAQFR